MLMGIVAAAGLANLASAPFDFHADALVAFDFENNDFRIGGVATALADMLDRTDNYVGGALVCDWGTSDHPNAMQAAVLSALPSANMTAYIDFTPYESSTSSTILNIRKDTGTDWYEFGIYSKPELVEFDDLFDPGAGAYRFLSAVPPAEPVRRKVACTHRASSCALSLNGGTAVTLSDATTPPSMVPELGLFGGYSPTGSFGLKADIHRCFFYTAKADAVLPLMTI